MKKAKLLLLFFLFAIGVMADPCVVVTTSSGEAVFFLSEKPAFTYDGQTVKLSANNTLIEYSPTDVLRVELADRTPTSIGSVSSDRVKISYSISDDEVKMFGCVPNEVIRLYSVNGTLMTETKAQSNGEACLSISSLKSGIYVISSKQSSIKIIKK